jgi:hypothetical protein
MENQDHGGFLDDFGLAVDSREPTGKNFERILAPVQ